MKRLIIIILFLSVHWVQAQYAWNFGVHAGVGTTFLKYTEESRFIHLEQGKLRTNYHAGLWIKRSFLEENISLESALNIYNRNSITDIVHGDFLNEDKVVIITNHYKYNTWLVRIPVLLGYTFKKISFLAGPVLDYTFSENRALDIEVEGYPSYRAYAEEQGYDYPFVDSLYVPHEQFLSLGLELHLGYQINLAGHPARVEVSAFRRLQKTESSYPIQYDFDVRLIYFLKPD